MNKKIIAGLVGLGLVLGPGYGLETKDTYASEAQDSVKEKEEELKRLISIDDEFYSKLHVISQDLENKWDKIVFEANKLIGKKYKDVSSLDSLISEARNIRAEIEKHPTFSQEVYRYLVLSGRIIDNYNNSGNKTDEDSVISLKQEREKLIGLIVNSLYSNNFFDKNLSFSELQFSLSGFRSKVDSLLKEYNISPSEITNEELSKVLQELKSSPKMLEALKRDSKELKQDYIDTLNNPDYKNAEEKLKRDYEEAYNKVKKIEEENTDFDNLHIALEDLYNIRTNISHIDIPRLELVGKVDIGKLPDLNPKLDKIEKKEERPEEDQPGKDDKKEEKNKETLEIKALSDKIQALEALTKEDSFKKLDESKKKSIDEGLKEAKDLVERVNKYNKDPNSIKDADKPSQDQINAMVDKLDGFIKEVDKDTKLDFGKLLVERNEAKLFKDDIFYKVGNKTKKVDFDKLYNEAVDLIQNPKKDDKTQDDVDKLAKDLKNAREALTFTDKSLDDLDKAQKRLESLRSIHENIKEYIEKNEENIGKQAIEDYKNAYKNSEAYVDSKDLSKVENAYKNLYEAVKNLNPKNKVDSLKALVDGSEDFKKTDDFKNIPEDKDILRTSYIALIKEAKDLVNDKNPDETRLSKVYDHIQATKDTIKGELDFEKWLIKNEIYLEDKSKAQDKYKKIKDLAQNEKDDRKKQLYQEALEEYDDLLAEAKKAKDLSKPELDLLYKKIKNVREYLTNDKVGADLYVLRKVYLDLVELEGHRAFEILDENSKVKIKNARARIKESIDKKDEDGQIKKGLEEVAKLKDLPEFKSIEDLKDKGYLEDSKVFDLNNLILKYGDLAKDVKYTKAQKKFRDDFDKNLKIAKDLVEGKKTDEEQVTKAYEALKNSIENLDGDKFEAASFALAKKFKDNQDKIKDVDKRKAIAEKINSLKDDKTKTMDDLLAIEAELDKLIEDGKSTLAKIVSSPSTADVKTTTVPVSNTKNSGTSVKTGIKSVAKVIGIGAVAAIILYFVSRKGDKNEINK